MTEADDKPYGEDGVGASVLNEVVDWTILFGGTRVPGVYMRTNALVRKKNLLIISIREGYNWVISSAKAQRTKSNCH